MKGVSKEKMKLINYSLPTHQINVKVELLKLSIGVTNWCGVLAMEYSQTDCVKLLYTLYI